MDWVNRFGPAEDWFAILSAFTTKDIERLIKIFVVGNGCGTRTTSAARQLRVRIQVSERRPDTRVLLHYLGHKNIMHTVRSTELSPERFKNFWEY